jgi:hypothetical protein
MYAFIPSVFDGNYASGKLNIYGWCIGKDGRLASEPNAYGTSDWQPVVLTEYHSGATEVSEQDNPNEPELGNFMSHGSKKAVA